MDLNHVRRGAGEPLVLVHGLGSRWQVWSAVLDRLAAEDDVTAVDLPGFGDSSPLAPGTPSNVHTLTDALAAFLAAQGIDRPHVAGNSMGGWIALELGKRDLVTSAIAISPAGFWTDREAAFARASLAGAVKAVRALMPVMPALVSTGAGRTALMAQLIGRPWKVPADDALSAMRGLADSPAFDETLQTLTADRYRPAPIDAPVTIAWGTRDHLLIPRQGPRAQRMVPGSRLVSLPGLGHAPCWDDPELVSRTILEGSARAA
jgi:pimeloyl-ACP methyl ester carboxylesterase